MDLEEMVDCVADSLNGDRHNGAVRTYFDSIVRLARLGAAVEAILKQGGNITDPIWDYYNQTT